MTFESHNVRDSRIDVGVMLGAVTKRLPRVIVITVLFLAATFVVLTFMPRLYESSASILVESRSNAYNRASNEQAPSSGGSEAGVVSSQIELLKSRDTLMTVIDKLDLRSVSEFNGAGAGNGGFSPFGIISQLLGRRATPVSVDETALNMLYERLTVVQERDSRIISVLVNSTDPQMAADIANAVASAHVARRAGLSLSDTAEASGWLAEEIAKLRVSVMAAETAVANFKVANDLFTGANNTSLLNQNLSAIATQISAAQERKSTALSRAALIRGMIEHGQPIDGVADVRESVVIQQLNQEKARLQGEKAQRSATLLSNHPTIQALTAQIAELNNQISLEGRRVADALESEAQVEADLEASLQADLSRAKNSVSTATTDTVTLDGLERDATAQRDLLEAYLRRYSEATTRVDANSALPDVRVVSIAAPSVTPVSPKTSLILLAVGIVTLATQLGVIIFGELISGRAIIAIRPPERAQDELDEVPFSADELEPEQRWEGPLVDVEPEVVATAAATEFSDAPEALDIEPTQLEHDFLLPEASPTREQSGEAEHFIQALLQGGSADFIRDEAPEPELEPTSERDAEHQMAPTAMSRPSPGVTALADLTSDLVLGRTHMVILAAHRENLDCAMLAEELVGDALARGLSVALIDAGSAEIGDEPGLTDLSHDAASFGDVVHKSADNRFAEVPWGQGEAFDPDSTKPLTLVEALGDIYEVVVLLTGRVGHASSLPLFDGLDGRLVLVAGNEDELDAVIETQERLLAAGFERCEIAAAPARVAA